MFTIENTEGYTQTELDQLNAELAERLEGVEPHTDKWYQAEKAFSDEVARR